VGRCCRHLPSRKGATQPATAVSAALQPLPKLRHCTVCQILEKVGSGGSRCWPLAISRGSASVTAWHDMVGKPATARSINSKSAAPSPRACAHEPTQVALAMCKSGLSLRPSLLACVYMPVVCATGSPELLVEVDMVVGRSPTLLVHVLPLQSSCGFTMLHASHWLHFESCSNA